MTPLKSPITPVNVAVHSKPLYAAHRSDLQLRPTRDALRLIRPHVNCHNRPPVQIYSTDVQLAYGTGGVRLDKLLAKE